MMSAVIMRNRTNLFEQFRRSYRVNSIPINSKWNLNEKKEYSSVALRDPDETAIELKTFTSVNFTEELLERKVSIERLITDINNSVDRLRLEYDRNKVPIIDWRLDKSAGGGEIVEHLLKQITGMFITAQSKIDSLISTTRRTTTSGSSGSSSSMVVEHLSNVVNEEIKELKRNARLALMAKLGRSADFLRQVQAEYTQRVSVSEGKKRIPLVQTRKFSSPPRPKSLFSINEGLAQQDDYDGQERVQLLIDPYQVEENDKELEGVAQSILQVCELLRSIQTLVIEQGSLLDNIDYNLERTRNHIHCANSELKRTFKKNHLSLQSRKLFLLFLMMLVLLLFIAVCQRVSLRK